MLSRDIALLSIAADFRSGNRVDGAIQCHSHAWAMPTGRNASTRGRSARTEASISLFAGLVVTVVVSALSAVVFGVVAGLDAAAAVYITWVWITVWPLDGDDTARLAAREDPTRTGADLALLTAALLSLVAVGFVLGGAARIGGAEGAERAALGLGSVVISWGLIHTVYTLRYARLYYTGNHGGVDFNQDGRPGFSDFAYLAFTIGMTFQVSDTDLKTREIRATALRHGLLSYMFGVGLIATTINLVASLTSG
jgi:uncharacterized membrane protein